MRSILLVIALATSACVPVHRVVAPKATHTPAEVLLADFIAISAVGATMIGIYNDDRNRSPFLFPTLLATYCGFILVDAWIAK